MAGGGENWIDQSLHAVGSRIALELNRHAATVPATFDISDSAEETFVFELKTTVATISRDDGAGPLPVIDVYHMDTATALTEDYARRSMLLKAVIPLVILAFQVVPRLARWPFRTAPRIVTWALGKVGRSTSAARLGRPTTLKDQFQFVFASGTALLLSFYVMTLIWAAVETADPTLIKGVSERIPQAIVLAASAVGLTTGVVKALTQAAVDQLCMILYLGDGYRRDVLRGRLSALIEHVREKPGVDYSRIVLVGYSFGTVVSIDALFPFDERPSPHFDCIDAFVTIGCPFDIVRTYWPTYFTGRTRLPEVPATWVNIYSPIDVLGSNFRDDSKTLDADRGISLRDEPADQAVVTPTANVPYASGIPISWRHALTMNGLRAHGLYWETRDEGEVSAFAPLVSRIYAAGPVLA